MNTLRGAGVGRVARPLLVVTVGFLVVLAASVPVAGAPGRNSRRVFRCQGRVATIVGTPGNDVLVGTKRADVIVGLGGRDLLRGGGGNDVICGGGGADRIVGGAGDDLLSGDGGHDRIAGGPGARDQCRGGRGSDRAVGCEARAGVRPWRLQRAADAVVSRSLQRVNRYRRVRSDGALETPAGRLGDVPARVRLPPVYLDRSANRWAGQLLGEAIAANDRSGRVSGSRTFRYLADLNGVAVVQATCTPLAGRPTAALPRIISNSILGAADVRFLLRRRQIDRFGLAWQERNDCLYWTVVLGAPLPLR